MKTLRDFLEKDTEGRDAMFNLMGQKNKEHKERNLTARIRECEERTKIREMLRRKEAEMTRLLAEHRANGEKLTESFNRYKEAMKH